MFLKYFSCAYFSQEDKVYVQHKILTEEFLLKDFLYKERGSFFIAGNAKQMPDQVLDALKRGLCETCGLSAKESDSFVERMEKDGRLQTETWS